MIPACAPWHYARSTKEENTYDYIQRPLGRYIKPTDETLNCEQLAAEIAELQRFKDEAEGEKGVNWSNAGRLIVFPIGIWATYSNANEAINAVNQREVYLRGIKGRNNCT